MPDNFGAGHRQGLEPGIADGGRVKYPHCGLELIDYKSSGLNSAQRGRRRTLINAPAITDARDHAAALMDRKT
jgi:hypothetical protein